MDNNTIKERLLALMDKNAKDFLSITDIKKGLSIADLKSVSLNRNSKNPDVINQLKLSSINGLELIYKGKSVYVCRHKPSQMILNLLLRMKHTNKKASLLDLLRKITPLKKDVYIQNINKLIDDKLIKNSFKDTFSKSSPTVYLYLLKENKPAINLDDDILSFKKAYDFIGKGRGFVRIHRIREYLNWDRNRFDSVLKKLTHDLIIELHGGDPSIMTKAEIEDSYVDPRTGFLFITMTWWGKK